MAQTGVSGSAGQADLHALLGLGGVAQPAGQGALSGAYAPDANEEVSIAGVMLLSAVSVCMAIMAIVMFALMLLGSWWLVSHIPVPTFVSGLLRSVHIL